MKKLKNEQIKVMLIVVLAIIFIFVAYFRFFQNNSIRATATGTSPAVQLTVPQINPAAGTDKPKESTGEGSLISRAVIRNIFEQPEADLLKSGSKTPSLEKAEGIPPPPLKLSGTVADTGSAIAIINGKFLRKGDWIEGYQVIEIDDHKVLLSGNGRKIVLNVITILDKQFQNP